MMARRGLGALVCVVFVAVLPAAGQLQFVQEDGSVREVPGVVRGVQFVPIKVVMGWSYSQVGSGYYKRSPLGYYEGEEAIGKAVVWRSHWGDYVWSEPYSPTDLTRAFHLTSDYAESGGGELGRWGLGYDGAWQVVPQLATPLHWGYRNNINDGIWQPPDLQVSSSPTFEGDLWRMMTAGSVVTLQQNVGKWTWCAVCGNGGYGKGVWATQHGGGDAWVDVVVYEVRDWDGSYGGLAGFDDANIVAAIQAFNGDFLEWRTDGSGWKRAMFAPLTSKPYLQSVESYLSGMSASALKSGGTTVAVKLDGILSALESPSVDGGVFDGASPGSGFISEQITPRLSGHGFSVFEPEGTDDQTAPVWEIQLDIGSWFAAGGMDAPDGMESLDLVVDTSVFEPFRATLHAIWLAGVSLWGMGRVWGELRK